jgi:hypothetical protein
LVEEGLLNEEPVRRLINRPQSGGAVSSKIWALTALEIWFRVFMVPDRSTQECIRGGGEVNRSVESKRNCHPGAKADA